MRGFSARDSKHSTLRGAESALISGSEGAQRDREAGEHYGALRVGASMQSEPN